MNVGSICSGVGTDALAWHKIEGWSTKFFAEIDPFCSSILSYHFPMIPNIGDFSVADTSKIKAACSIDLVIGGTPCQAFSTAGRRRGMDEARGTLATKHVQFAYDLGARWIVWENVHGVLFSNQGRDFSTFRATLEECGYGYAWRVLDAAYFGVPQRRRRVFLIGYSGDWRPSAAVLFECRRNSSNARAGEKAREPRIARTRKIIDTDCRGEQESPERRGNLGIADCTGGRGNHGSRLVPDQHDYCTAYRVPDLAKPLLAKYGSRHNLGDENWLPYQHLGKSYVRRLSPLERERLQGLPDGWTQIPYKGRPRDECPSGLREHATGNGFVMSVVRWLGERIDKVDRIISDIRP